MIVVILYGVVFSGQAQVQTPGEGMPWWVWIFGAVILIFLVSGVWIRSQGKGVVRPEKDLVGAANEPKSQPRLRAAQAPEPASAPASDHLEIIEGIGPRIAELLKGAGITRFSQLAAATPQQIDDLLTRGGLRAPVDPTTWPDQARLAAAGQWQALKDMQDGLKAGRRVN